MLKLRRKLALYMGKVAINISKLANRSGTAFPGKVALTMDKHFLEEINEKCEKIIIVTGTNGKTTTNNLINHVLKDNTLLSNLKGANMIQGIATTYVKNTKNKYDYGIFEVDEGSLDRITKYIHPDYIILTNFFRDQLDRYGEIEGIISEVLNDIKKLPDTTLIINADDAYVNQFKEVLPNKIITFGLNISDNNLDEKNLLLKKCPICGNKINFLKHTYGHLGDYNCPKCGFNNLNKDFTVTKINHLDSSQKIMIKNNDTNYEINYPYIGIYNAYNVCGVFALTNEMGLDNQKTISSFEDFSFNLGRMEEFTYENKKIKVILTKNPIGLSQATKIISNDSREKVVVHILNDNPADGRDISWIWDANTYCTNDTQIKRYYCSGRRSEEIALKKKYDDVDVKKIVLYDNYEECINDAIKEEVEIIYVLPTYTAIFQTRDYINALVGGK